MIYFRVDGNSKIASGHIKRCLSIANVMQNRGHKCIFIVSDNDSQALLANERYPIINLHSDWLNLLSEVDSVKEIIATDLESILFIDTYSVNQYYVDMISSVSKVIYLGSKDGYLGKLDALINYSTNIDYKKYKKLYCGTKTKLYLGPRYAPLRPEFTLENGRVISSINNVLLTTGNTNKDGVFKNIIDIVLSKNKDINIIAVIGSMFYDKDELKRAYKNNSRVKLFENVSSMSELMKICDLAISANGTTVYELAAIGVPVISFAMVKEQEKSAIALSQKGALRYCGLLDEGREQVLNNIANEVSNCINDIGKTLHFANIANQLIDGKGCERIAEIIENEF